MEGSMRSDSRWSEERDLSHNCFSLGPFYIKEGLLNSKVLGNGCWLGKMDKSHNWNSL